MKDRKGVLDAILTFAQKVVEILRNHHRDNLSAVALFGSVARDTFRQESDIDLLVVLKEAPRSYHRRVKEGLLPLLDSFWETDEFQQMGQTGFQGEPSFLVLTEEEVRSHPPLFLDFSHEALLLYDPAKLLEQECKKVKEKLKVLGSQRKVMPDGTWYWVLKPDLKFGEKVDL